MEWVRQHYSVPAKRNGRVLFCGQPGRITSACPPYLRLELDGLKGRVSVHPTWEMEYL